MKKFLTILALCLFTSVAVAGTTIEQNANTAPSVNREIERPVERAIYTPVLATSFAKGTTIEQNGSTAPTVNSEVGNLPTIDYTPVQAITFGETMTMTTMSMAYDGTNYYGNDGGNYNDCTVETYDLTGGLLNSVFTGLDQRGMFYNDNDGLFYIKEYYNRDLYTVDPSTGAVTLVHAAVFNGSQSCMAYDCVSNNMYELSSGTVYEIDLATGVTTNTWTATGNYAIAWNGVHFFTRSGTTVYVYDTNFALVESWVLPSGGSNNYSLSYANGLLWVGDGASWYGFSGCEGVPCGGGYAPSLCSTIPHTMPVTPMTMISDGGRYYMNNGGIASQGVIETYTLSGAFVQSVNTNLDTRGFFYNPNDGQFYIKDYYGPSLFTIDPNTGVSTVVYTGIWASNQSCLAYDPVSNWMYELAYGTVYAYDLATGSLMNSWAGVSGSYAIAYNGCDFITYDGSTGYVYSSGFNLIESWTLPSGGNTYSLGFANGMLWTIANGTNAYGYCGVSCNPVPSCVDIGITAMGPTSVPQGGTLSFEGSLTNNTGAPQTVNVWLMVNRGASWYNTGLEINNIPLPIGGNLLSGTIGLNVPVCAVPDAYSLIAYVGNNPWDPCNSFSLPFTVTGTPCRVASGYDEWTAQGSWDFESEVPSSYSLTSNYPNPFNATTAINYDLPTAGNVSLEVYNLMGQKVATLVDGHVDAGQHAVTWDAGDYSSGMYFYKLTSGDNVITKRMTLLK